jgi:hypothetical protein
VDIARVSAEICKNDRDVAVNTRGKELTLHLARCFEKAPQPPVAEVPQKRGIQRRVGGCLTEGIAALGLIYRAPYILKFVAAEGINLYAKIVLN